MRIISYRNILVILGIGIMVASLAIVGYFGLKLSIDFTGGSLTEVVYVAVPSKAELESSLGSLNLGGLSLREATDETGRGGFILRTRDLSEAERAAVEGIVISVGEGGEVTRFTSIGPVIGQELKDKALWAIGGVVLVIVLYIAFAFSRVGKPVNPWVYGVITVFVLAHDVLVPAALVSLLTVYGSYEVDVLFITAILAILGYSVNDTIVVFDRVRENLIKNRTEKKTKQKLPGGIEREEVTYTYHKPFSEIVGQSVDETIVRSVNTPFTTFLALLALYLVGAEVTKVFALVLITGVVAGTYSSIFLASPLLVVYAERFALKDQNAK